MDKNYFNDNYNLVYSDTIDNYKLHFAEQRSLFWFYLPDTVVFADVCSEVVVGLCTAGQMSHITASMLCPGLYVKFWNRSCIVMLK